MDTFDHERLDVYQLAVEFVAVATELVACYPPGTTHLRDQLSRAATSVVLNIAEGAGEFSKPEKARFYRMARRSATECAAVLDVLKVVKLVEGKPAEAARAILIRVVSMLTRMVLGLEGSGTGRGTGAGTGTEKIGGGVT
ncbi:MAG TPA: four helix bundle protein [Gemmataceae bacterium]|jgi:four helix bundle protein|nr:four helix bundle protein [Gemmataceae bacterium]